MSTLCLLLYALLSFLGVVDAYIASNRRLSIARRSPFLSGKYPLPPSEKNADNDSVYNSSPSAANQSLDANISSFGRNLSSLFEDERPQLGANSSSFRNKVSQLRPNSSSPFMNKMNQLNSKAASPAQPLVPLSLPLSACSLSRPSAQPLSFPRPPNQKHSLNKTSRRKVSIERGHRKLDSRMQTANLRPVPPPGHNEGWNGAWIRGKAAWNALPTGQRGRDSPPVDLAGWSAHCLGGSQPPMEDSPDIGLLAKIDAADGTTLSLSSRTYHSWMMNHQTTLGIYGNDVSPWAGAIINTVWAGRSLWDESSEVADDPPASASWADIACRLWVGTCHEDDRPPSSLKYVVFPEELYPQIAGVFRDIKAHDSSLDQLDEHSNTGMVTYTPEDDNFYALLGSETGIGAIELIHNYPITFSSGNSMRKTIQNVRLVGHRDTRPDYMAEGPGWRPGEQPNYDHFAWSCSFAFTLRDTFPPGNTGPPRGGW